MVPKIHRSFFTLLAFALGLVTAEDAWSFKEFLAGDWNLERRIQGQVEHAHYSLRAEGASLEGTYYEEVEQGRANEMVVRVLFDDATSGQFQLAKLKQPDPQADADEPPIPQPQPEPKTAFEFDFRSQSELFHLSASQWLGKAGGTVQFLAMEDSFVFSKVTCAGDSSKAEVQSWTAVRVGATRRVTAPADAKRSLLQRYGWYVFFALLYFGYQAAKDQAAKAMAGMGKGQ